MSTTSTTKQGQDLLLDLVTDAHAAEVALVRVLQSQIAMTPRGEIREGLEKHLTETRDHAERLQDRAGELGGGRGAVGTATHLVTGAVEVVAGQALALAKTPLDLVRGADGEEKVLRNVRDACATEALEIATYTALERVASDLDDDRTARLAASILEDEREMLDRLLAVLPRAADDLVRRRVRGVRSFDATTTGAADAARTGARKVRETAQDTADDVARAGREARDRTDAAARTATKTAAESVEDAAEDTKRTARRTAARAESGAGGTGSGTKGGTKRSSTATKSTRSTARSSSGSGASASTKTAAERRPWASYDEENAADIAKRLADETPAVADRVAAYEKAHEERKTVLAAADSHGTD